jgi:transaldolase
VTRTLNPETAAAGNIEKLEITEPRFRFLLNEDQMATEKTSEGIRSFVADTVKLAKFVAPKL